jgi:hypothetical protein
MENRSEQSKERSRAETEERGARTHLCGSAETWQPTCKQHLDQGFNTTAGIDKIGKFLMRRQENIGGRTGREGRMGTDRADPEEAVDQGRAHLVFKGIH